MFAPRSLGAALALLALAAPAYAAAQQTPMATLDRVGPGSVAGAQFALGVLDDDTFDSADGYLRFDFFGRFAVADSLSLYGALSLAQSLSEGDDDLGLSNLDLGLHYRVGPHLVVRGGLLLPTASDGGASASSNALARNVRVIDGAMRVPDATWLRFSLNYLYASGRVFLQGDVGADIAFIADGDNPDPILHLDGGVGLRFTAVTLAIELANGFDLNGNDDWEATLGPALRFHSGRTQPYVGVFLPIDRGGELIFAVGVASRL